MANTLGAYNPIFYASEALIHLRKELGMAARVHRGYDAERRSFERGETVRIKKPSTFTVSDAPATAADLATEYVDITLGYWREVKFALTDRERAFTTDQIVAEHIAPAAYALADDVDQKLALLYKDVPWLHDYGSEADHDIIVDARKYLRDNHVPLNDGKIHQMVNSTVETYYLKSSVFHSADVAGSAAAGTLLKGSLGTRFGIEVFSNQNCQSHVPGTLASGGDTAGALSGAHALGATTVHMTALGSGQTIAIGDTFVIAGNTQRHAVTATATVGNDTAVSVSVTPALKAAYASGAVVTWGSQQTSDQILTFHENAFALVVAPLPDDIPGAEAFTAVDPVSGLSVRARRFYIGDTSKLYMALDILYGVKTLDGNLAVRSWT
jgi:hypothetical protein